MLDLELDHLGLIVSSIEKEMPFYEPLGYTQDGAIFQDNNQQMRGVFLKSKHHRLELIEDLSESKALKQILNSKCGKIYHLAYKVTDLEKNLASILEQLNAHILSPIKDGEYYKKVAFIFLKNGQIIELVEYR